MKIFHDLWGQQKLTFVPVCVQILSSFLSEVPAPLAGNSFQNIVIYKVCSPFQLTANLLVFVAVNLVGLFVHNLMEHAQRRAFLDTRNCIAARLEMEDENEKLVRFFSC